MQNLARKFTARMGCEPKPLVREYQEFLMQTGAR
jgi:hypothetical protein